jgi:DNA-binding NtrC family response regulator
VNSESGGPLAILVVDDNRSAADAIALLLGRGGHTVEAVYDGQTAINRIQQQRWDLVLTDLRMEPVDGLQVVRAARGAEPPMDVVVFTAFGSVEIAVEAMRLGAMDFLTKPVTADQILRRVQELRQGGGATGDIQIVGDSEATVRVREQAARLAKVRSTVLLTGETGTGRRHLARWLHNNGLDRDRPLLVARPNQTFDPDVLAAAGTLLVPGIDDWSPEAQIGLLRTLEGLDAGSPPRVIATANPDVDVRVARGDFPPELYFRLAVLVVAVSPLRERPQDLEPLIGHFMALQGPSASGAVVRPSADQLRNLSAHGWPGNAREVANLAERAVVLGAMAFDMNVKPQSGVHSSLPELAEGFNLAEHMEVIERTLLVRAIEQTAGDRPLMGKVLGLERNTLRYKLNKYGLLDRT